MKIHISRTKGRSTPVCPWLLVRYHDLLLELSSLLGIHQTLNPSSQQSFSQPVWYTDGEDLDAHIGRAPPHSRHPLAAVPDPHSRLRQVHTSCVLGQPTESAGIGYSWDLANSQTNTRYSKQCLVQPDEFCLHLSWPPGQARKHSLCARPSLLCWSQTHIQQQKHTSPCHNIKTWKVKTAYLQDPRVL